MVRATGSLPEAVPGHRLHQLAATLRTLLWPGPAAVGLHWPGRLPGLHWPHRPPGLHWPREEPAPRWPFAWVDVAWGAFSIANLVAMGATIASLEQPATPS